MRDQQAGQARQALLVLPGFVLGHGGAQILRQGLRSTHLGQTDDVVTELALRVLLREQGVQHGLHISCGERLLQFAPLG